MKKKRSVYIYHTFLFPLFIFGKLGKLFDKYKIKFIKNKDENIDIKEQWHNKRENF